MNIIVTSHGDLCLGLIDSLEMLAGEQEKVIAISLKKNDTGQFKEEFRLLVEEKLSEPTLILCDILGGTPYNESHQLFLEHPDYLRVVSGVNLAMLIECTLSVASMTSLQELSEVAINSGKQSIEEVLLETNIEEDEIEF
ncbi:MAG: PTS sugar transporter subunit IIA [Tetragenococcus koreensis]|nr:PTS sugar transporter subunit IIA [Tetragenococcus koreensis]MDN6749879.1 PTS sugar transporter subunit IIA [Staphylococcus equorum]MDN6146185.1 PTS sugar transporter subunit IIA [Tetragenococcus koreensis]MDN6266630.1 PTS sugar transporter subunit IIA [Tetragenococcus koreensis]MDN6579662.1 PTS sugar transporter subunit IIA [Tetragenococcus koreensis]